MLADMDGIGSALDGWKRRRDAFRWETPDPWNFGTHVVDRFASEPSRPALLWRDAGGAERRLTYADVAGASNRFAHLLRSLGVAPGDPIVVMLPKLPEWQIALIGALKAGCLVIPSSVILRPKDIEYRVNHSGSVALITTQEQVPAVDSVRANLSTLRHCLSLSPPQAGRSPARSELKASEAPGWLDFESALAAQPHDASAPAADARVGSCTRLLHLRYHGPAEGRAAFACLHLDPALHRRVLARSPRRRPTLDHQRHGLGQGCL